MKANGIQAKLRNRSGCTLDEKKNMLFKNYLNREFSATRPNEKWVTDITYLLFKRKEYLLSTILDLYNIEINSYKIRERNDLKLVADTIKGTIKKRDV